jgi:hypothetical protein
VITSIGYYAFEECISLTALPAMPGVVELEYAVFSRCDGLVSIQIPDTLRIVGIGTFRECKNLQTVSIPATGIQLGSTRRGYSPHGSVRRLFKTQQRCYSEWHNNI